MTITLSTEVFFLVRIVVAALCGAAIGYERESRLKTAGIRTHLIVSLAAAMMMVVSKYGFYDVLCDNIRLDPSRVAAGVVTAIGFLGAGVIFTHKQTVSGITTAAGIWATVGVGSCIGAGLYLVGVVSTVLLLIIQILLHRNFKWIRRTTPEQITFKIQSDEIVLARILHRITENHIKIMNTKITRVESELFKVRLDVQFPDSYSSSDLLQLIREEASIESMEL